MVLAAAAGHRGCLFLYVWRRKSINRLLLLSYSKKKRRIDRRAELEKESQHTKKYSVHHDDGDDVVSSWMKL